MRGTALLLENVESSREQRLEENFDDNGVDKRDKQCKNKIVLFSNLLQEEVYVCDDKLGGRR